MSTNATPPAKTQLDAWERDRLRTLATNLLLYVRRPDDSYFRPHALRFHRDGTVSGYDAGGNGWTKLTGYKADGPKSTDLWQF